MNISKVVVQRINILYLNVLKLNFKDIRNEVTHILIRRLILYVHGGKLR